ncbi:hypothetical protein GCM10022212_11870 [Actimicrobium antarcticum]|uniref:Uncharacterized protein n=1 Tax=Actimicrobium antarcticum TaxID=1051899 RepID=A0ABP7SX40_9BURK
MESVLRPLDHRKGGPSGLPESAEDTIAGTAEPTPPFSRLKISLADGLPGVNKTHLAQDNRVSFKATTLLQNADPPTFLQESGPDPSPQT